MNVSDLVIHILHTANWPVLILFLTSLILGLLIVVIAIAYVLTNIVILFVNKTVSVLWKPMHQNEHLENVDIWPYKECSAETRIKLSMIADQNLKDYLAGVQAEEVVAQEVIENYEKTKKHL